MQEAIIIDDVEIKKHAGTPTQYPAKHSNKTLHGIDLSLITNNPDNDKNIRALIDKKTVTVQDPYCEQTYQATIHQTSQSYQEGRPERQYRITIRELDQPPVFQELEIDGKPYPVMKYEEREDGESSSMHAVIKLTPEDVATIKDQHNPTATVRRISIDDTPKTMRYGRGPYWSEHKDGDTTYCKMLVHFFPIESQPTYFPIASDTDLGSMANLLLHTAFRTEALIEELHKAGHVDQPTRDALLGPTQAFLTLPRRQAIVREFSKLRDVEQIPL